MSDEEMITLFPVWCDGECGRVLGYNRTGDVNEPLICQDCMKDPDAMVERIRSMR